MRAVEFWKSAVPKIGETLMVLRGLSAASTAITLSSPSPKRSDGPPEV